MAERRGGNLPAISKEMKQLARNLYMDGKNPVEIQEATKISANTIYAWIRRDGWKDERLALKLMRESDAIIVRDRQLNHILHQSYESIINLVDTFKKAPLSLDDGMKLVKIISELNKLNRVNEGRPTDMKGEHRIIENREVKTDSEVRDVLNADPFVEVEWEEESSDNES